MIADFFYGVYGAAVFAVALYLIIGVVYTLYLSFKGFKPEIKTVWTWISKVL